MVEEQHKVNGDVEVENGCKQLQVNGVESPYVLVDNGSNDVVVVEAGFGDEDLGKEDAGTVEESVGAEILSDCNGEDVTDDCNDTVKAAELARIDNSEEGFDGTLVSSEPIVEVDEAEYNVGRETEDQDPEGGESVDNGNCPAEGVSAVMSFDCCCVPVGGGISKTSSSADENVGGTVVGKVENPIVSFDCCSVPVGSCEGGNDSSAGESTARSVVGPADSIPIENFEGTRVDDDEMVAESETLDVENSGEDTNINKEVTTISDRVDSVPNSPGSKNSQDVMEGAGSQHIPVDETNEGSGLMDSLEKEKRNHTSSCVDSTTEITVEGKSAPDADTADNSTDVSEVVNGDTVPNGKLPNHINDTTIEAGVVEESAKQESMESGDTQSEFIVKEATDSSTDASGNKTVESAPEAVEVVTGSSIDASGNETVKSVLKAVEEATDSSADSSDSEIVKSAPNAVEEATDSSKDASGNETFKSNSEVVEEATDSSKDASGNGTVKSALEVVAEATGSSTDASGNETVESASKAVEEVTSSSTDASGTETVESAPKAVEEVINGSMDAGNETVKSARALEAAADQGVFLDNDDKSNCQESEEVSSSPEVKAATSSCEIPVVEEVVIRPFYFLARHPRFEDTNLRDQLELAQLEVDEKTKERDAIRTKIQDMRSTRKGFDDEVEDSISNERGMRDLLRSKRQEMDLLQSMMNTVKNAIFVEDINVRIHNLQHMIEHETLPLNEEKQFIREINQLKQQRARLSTNVGKGEEVQKVINEKDKTEERLKALKKEADAIRVKLSRFEDDRKSSKNKYSDENKKLSDLQAKFRAENDIRQTAYIRLQSLRKQMYEKNKYFRGYKDDIKTVDSYISTKNKGELHRYCVNQVESFMDLWNDNAEFRKEYIRCNTRSTLRRLGTMDGRSLGPEEKPVVIPPVIMYNSKFAKVKSVSQTKSLEQEKQVENVGVEKIDEKPAIKVVEPNTQMAKSGKSRKSAPVNSTTAVSRRVETAESMEVSKKSEEEEEAARREKELARRKEEQRKEEEAARLKELRRLEEKVKAKEAMERKKRQAEKAKVRAALKAQKEAEERERERERRAKKKENKKTTALEATDSSIKGDIPPTFEDRSEDVKEPESKDKPNTVSKKPQRPSHFGKHTKSKSIPLPLRNRSKKRMQSWMWLLVVAVLVFALFLLGNSSWSLPFVLNRFGF